jgi:anti-anti-sigma regulatory factor
MQVKVDNASESNQPDAVNISLAAILDPRAAKPLKDMLAAGLSGIGAVMIDASAVSQLSTSAIQVLIAFLAAMAAARRRVIIVRPSVTFLAGFESLGLSSLIQPAVTEA